MSQIAIIILICVVVGGVTFMFGYMLGDLHGRQEVQAEWNEERAWVKKTGHIPSWF